MDNKRKKGYKNNGNFYIYTLLGAVVVCVLIGILAYSATTSSNPRNKIKATNNVVESEEREVPQLDTTVNPITSTGLIEEIDSKVLFLYDILEDKRYQLDVNSGTVIVDKYDKPLILAELSTGDIVDFTFPEDKISLTKVQKSGRAWEFKKINIQFHDTDENVLTMDSKDYKYDDKTIIEYIRGDYPIKNISTHDTITVSGYGEKIYYIRVLKGHGTIDFINNEKIVNGVIEVNTTDIIKMDNIEPIVVPEGAHKIVVKGENINPFTENIYVEANGTNTVDLTKILTKRGLFLPVVNVKEYSIIIDEEEIATDEPILLDYGAYALRVEAEGYVGYEGVLNIKSPETQMKIQLDERVLMKKMAITSNPSGANIYVDNEFIGTTPLTENIVYGPHTVSAKLEGYIDLSIPINIDDEIRPGVDFTFTKKDNIIPTEATTGEDVVGTEGNGSSLFGN